MSKNFHIQLHMHTNPGGNFRFEHCCEFGDEALIIP